MKSILKESLMDTSITLLLLSVFVGGILTVFVTSSVIVSFLGGSALSIICTAIVDIFILVLGINLLSKYLIKKLLD